MISVLAMGGQRVVTVAATQQSCSWDIEANLQAAEKHVRAAAKGEHTTTPYITYDLGGTKEQERAMTMGMPAVWTKLSVTGCFCQCRWRKHHSAPRALRGYATLHSHVCLGIQNRCVK